MFLYQCNQALNNTLIGFEEFVERIEKIIHYYFNLILYLNFRIELFGFSLLVYLFYYNHLIFNENNISFIIQLFIGFVKNIILNNMNVKNLTIRNETSLTAEKDTVNLRVMHLQFE